MHAITIRGFGGPDVLTWTEVPDPVPASGEVVIDVVAAGVNRADLLQREGHYPPPPGAPDIPGLECAGVISAVGPGVDGWQPGDRVCALLGGGGYAERVAVRADHVLPIPAGVTLVEAAAFPEAACTVWSTVFMAARARAGETLLIHGGASGIGTFAVQLATAWGLRVTATAGTAEKCERVHALGADFVINYRTQDFVAEISARTGGRGVDVVLDIVGAPYLARNLAVLAPDGRIVVIALQGGRRAELDLAALMTKRGSIYAAGLRARPPEQKAEIVSEVRTHVWPLIGSGQIRPVIEAQVPMHEAARAHRILEAGRHVGKVLLVHPERVMTETSTAPE